MGPNVGASVGVATVGGAVGPSVASVGPSVGPNVGASVGVATVGGAVGPSVHFEFLEIIPPCC